MPPISKEQLEKMKAGRKAEAANGVKTPRKMREFRAKDLIIGYLIDGLDVWESARVENKATTASFRGAYNDLVECGKAGDELTAWFLARFRSGRGRDGPSTGQMRRYRAQQLGEGDTFIRLPVGVLGVGKRETVDVAFDNGMITVRPTSPPQAAAA